jgi:hypothetical protein
LRSAVTSRGASPRRARGCRPLLGFAEERDGFTALGRPDADSAAFRQIIAYLEAEYAADIQLDMAAHSRDRRAFIAASNASDIAGGRWLTLADKFGLTDCTTSGL